MNRTSLGEKLAIGGARVLGSGFSLNATGIMLESAFGEHLPRPYWAATEATIAVGGLMMWCGFHILNCQKNEDGPDDPEREEIYDATIIPLSEARVTEAVPETLAA